MYINKCTKCGAEFETKNPKRVICPNCLYPDKKLSADNAAAETEEKPHTEYPANYSSYEEQPPQRRYENNPYQARTFNRERTYNTGYDRPQRNYDNNGSYRERPRYENRGMTYDRPQRNYNGQRNYGNRNGNYNNRGGYNNRPNRGFNGRRPAYNKRRPSNFKNRQLLVSKEQIAQIEMMYKKALPLPNPDIHEVIGQALQLEPRKVFFGINFIRKKMMLPKIPFPKRKLALTPDQLNAIKTLYTPLLPLPPIGCHKIIAAQLKMDEWRVHVGIGLIRKQMGLDRWNTDRPDIPEKHKNQQ